MQPHLVAAAARQVLEQVIQSPDEVLAAARHRLAQHLGVGQQEVARRERVDILPCVEVHLLRGLPVEPLDAAKGLVQVSRSDQVRLLDVVVEEILLPVLVLEAAVGVMRCRHRVCVLTHQLQQRPLPQRGSVLPISQLSLGELEGVRQQLSPRLKECLGNAEFVPEAWRAVPGALEELGDEPRAVRGNVGVDAGELGGVERVLPGLLFPLSHDGVLESLLTFT